MFCLRSWLPLLFIPTNAPPIFVLLFFACTFFLSRPCVYCSFLLIILFLTSCYWSDQCFFDLSSNWFEPRHTTSSLFVENGEYNSTLADMVLSTVTGLTGAATDGLVKSGNEWTGLGLEWLRSLLGRREWRIDCMLVNIRL
ncbi:hypothetical protein jhhlp_005489 [Lomentospora prolificans]|uniref:Uncharacterized protein n=1 Tax=Lomentospora prolificans TaxID=41688 RepID=A0A2N3MZB9_9PEZI|nr:hypothetical protein jhhlp_008044 [Lomentospora prolificans]PKS06894.1 hypothetical protein jhhlp_005489 [Lomentospora prolificans]